MKNQSKKEKSEQTNKQDMGNLDRCGIEITIELDSSSLTGKCGENLKNQLGKPIDLAAFNRGLKFALDPEGCGYRGMERMAISELTETEDCYELADMVFNLLCGDGSDSPHYHSSGEFWRNQFEMESAPLWVPTTMQTRGFYVAVQICWAEEGKFLLPS